MNLTLLTRKRFNYCFNELSSFNDETSLLLNDLQIRNLVESQSLANTDSDNSRKSIWKMLWPSKTPILLRPAIAYAITIHKSQGSEFEAVIIPVLTQHFKMLYRNLVYTGLTRARKLAVFIGTRKALAMAVKQQDTSRRQTALKQLLQVDFLKKS